MLSVVLFLLVFVALCAFVADERPSSALPQPRACSLPVRSAVVPSRCCLLQSRSGRPLSGAALAQRRARLVRAGVLVR
ncbi:MAG: hypothetical protein F6K04_01420 [Leptolyngbya sp. SIO4C5]|nr:hypothetical protein [Leptolyngbya sp. SIO4C5]